MGNVTAQSTDNSTITAEVDTAPNASAARGLAAFLDHPPGLFTLFFTEMWERFSFYLMLALLSLYLTEYLHFEDARASNITTWYISLVYCTPFLGGLLADRITGQVKAINYGGFLMMAGHATLAFDGKSSSGHPFLYLAMTLLILGNGLFKPNVSSLVGTLYPPKDPRRDQAYTIFYMGINVGAFLGPLAGNFFRTRFPAILRSLGFDVADESGWHIAFASAGVGMIISLVVFSTQRRKFPEFVKGAAEASMNQSDEFGGASAESIRVLEFGQKFYMVSMVSAFAWLLAAPAIPWPDSIRRVALWPTEILNFGKVWLVLEVVTVGIFMTGRSEVTARAAKLKTVFIVVAMFWMAFHQNSVSLTFFARDFTSGNWDAETFQAVNPFCILIFSPLMVLLWSRLGRRGKEPLSTTKISMSMIVTGLAYVVMVGAGMAGADSGEKVSPGWLVGTYMLLTVAELWISPIGLSLTSKLAPTKYLSLWMGFWFLATGVGNKLVHATGGSWGKYPPSELFLRLFVSSIAAAVILWGSLAVLKRIAPDDVKA